MKNLLKFKRCLFAVGLMAFIGLTNVSCKSDSSPTLVNDADQVAYDASNRIEGARFYDLLSIINEVHKKV